MINNPVVFYISSTLIILFALISLFCKDVIRALLAAIVVFFCGAIIFYALGSEYNAIIQAAIYGLAVPVIIGVSIMFTKPEKSSAKFNIIPVTAIISAEILLLAFVFVIMFSLATFPDTFHLTEIPQVNSFDVISSFAKGIFINYIWAFEIVSVLLTIVIAGFTLFKKGRAE